MTTTSIKKQYFSLSSEISPIVISPSKYGLHSSWERKWRFIIPVLIDAFTKTLKGHVKSYSKYKQCNKRAYLTAQRCKLDSNTPAQRFIRPTILRTYLRSIEKSLCIWPTVCPLYTTVDWMKTLSRSNALHLVIVGQMNNLRKSGT